MLFSNSCKEITVENKTHLDEIKNFLKNFTFENNDKGIDHEFLSLYRFLIATLKIRKISLPIVISKNDSSPDFRICCVGKEPYLGLEHTRATLPKYMMDVNELDKYPEGSLIELPYYQLGHTPPKKSSISLRKPGQKLMHPGYGDNEIEKRWTEIILDSIEKKIISLNSKKFIKYKENELLIEDVSPVPIFCRLDSGIKILKETYAKKIFNMPLNYNKVHIFSSHSLIYDVFGETITVDVSKSQL